MRPVHPVVGLPAERYVGEEALDLLLPPRDGTARTCQRTAATTRSGPSYSFPAPNALAAGHGGQHGGELRRIVVVVPPPSSGATALPGVVLPQGLAKVLLLAGLDLDETARVTIGRGGSLIC